MKVRYEDFMGMKFEEKISEVVFNSLSGEDYDRGQLEEISAEVKTVRKAFGCLCEILAVKGIINEKDLMEVIDSYAITSIEIVKEDKHGG